MDAVAATVGLVMETSLGISQAVISLEPTPLTSIENRKDSPTSEDIKPNINNRGCQVQRSKSGDGRYSVSSTSLKNNFYAIHHSFKTLNENNEPNQQQQQQQEKSAAVILSSSSPSSSSSSPFSTTATSRKNMVTVTPILLPTSPATVETGVASAPTPTPTPISASNSPSWTVVNTPPNDTTSNQISRKRVTPDPTTETRTSEITGVVSPSPATAMIEHNDTNNNNNNNNGSNKRKKLRQLIKHRKPIDSHSSANNNTSQEYCLFKSASSIWPGSTHSLGDFSHQNITDLSQLLKMRLCQAKFKMMATLDQDNDLFDFLNDEYLQPQPKVRRTIRLPTHHHQSTMSVVGNGKNLFRRFNKKQHQGQEQQQQQHINGNNGHNNNNTNSSNNYQSSSSSSLKENSNLDGKKQKQGSQSGKAKRISKRRSVACDVPSVLQSDGTRIYLCEPCGKKYKNRNGLTYHLERCKNKAKKDDSNTSNNNSDTINKLNCICPQSNEQQQQQQQPDSSLIQCEKCRSLLHTECMGLTADDASHGDFICPHCKVDPKQDEENTQKTVSTIVSKPSPLMDEHSDAPLADDEGGSPEETSPLNDYIHSDILNSHNNHNHHSNNHNDINNTNNNEEPSSALHVWDDFSFSSALDKVIEPWSMLSEEEPFSNYDSAADMPAQWNMNAILNQPPSLLFSDATMSSTLEDDSAMLSSELTPAPISELSPPATTSTLVPDPSTIIINNSSNNNNNNSNSNNNNNSNNNSNNNNNNNNTSNSNSNSVNTPVQHSDGLWFQFANFDDDYHCE